MSDRIWQARVEVLLSQGVNSPTVVDIICADFNVSRYTVEAYIDSLWD